jgi:hypothetical protein
MTPVLLTLVAPAVLEEQLVAQLLGHEPTAAVGFDIRDIRRHGDTVAYHDIAEQIQGYARMIEIDIALPENEVEDLLRRLASELPNLGIKYSLVKDSRLKQQNI